MKNVLLVEDNEMTVSWLPGYLRHSKEVTLDTVDEVDSAIKALTSTKYDLLILDWRLSEGLNPRVSCRTIVDYLAGLNKGQLNYNVPVLVATAHPVPANKELGHNYSGLIEVVSKLKMRELRLSVCAALGIEDYL